MKLSPDLKKYLKLIDSQEEHINAFFKSQNKIKFIKESSSQLIESLYLMIRFIEIILSDLHPELYNNLINTHEQHINKIHRSRTIDTMKKKMIDAHQLSGGSFFSHIGHFFKHAAHAVAHGVTHAAHEVAHGVTHAAHEVEHGVVNAADKVANVSKKVAKVAETAGKDIAKGAKTAYDYEKQHYRAQLSAALPYVEKYVINPLVDTGATALGTLVGAPELGELAQTGLTYGEKALNPYLKKKIKGNQTLF